ncbi:MAG: hypothetical protein IPO46_06150 [Chitinophagaceae bacterium]|nr:hypothetical protein [Chitinophagaceae bacterium]MBP6045570.1 hypothetical protein [Ferruginibacter sp.]NMD29956.1 hypothetical protein [Bacteroidota bacterium]MBK7089098.1 hypothetical protein [Chitinophagaceae bacterium]MBK7347739.1 hypothetical protein [Chitinophagaceae bacterium]
MPIGTSIKTINPLVFVFKHFMGKLRQQPDVYPIKYYKKQNPHRKSKQHPMVK